MIPLLLEAALRALLVALVVWAGLRALRVGNVFAQKAAWGLVLIAAMFMPMVMRWHWLPVAPALIVPARPWGSTADSPPAVVEPAPAPPSRALSSHPFVVSETPSYVPSGRFPAPEISHGAQPPSEGPRPALPAAPYRRTLPPETIGLLLYLAVLSGLLLRLSYGLVVALNLWRRATPIAPQLLGESSQGLSVRSSPAVSSPVTIGSGILLPSGFASWDAEKLRIVLAHERSHIRQGDFFLQILAGLHAALFWFSPLGWWLKRKLSALSETISDRAGLDEAASRTSYAQILLEFAALPRPTFQGVAMARRSTLSQRIERLLNESSFRQAFAGGRNRALVAVLLVPAALFSATAFIRVQAATPAAPPPPPQPVLAAQEPAQPAPPAQPATAAPEAAPAPETPPAPAVAPSAPAPPDSPGAPHIVIEEEVGVDNPEGPDSTSTSTDKHKNIVIRKERRMIVEAGHDGKGTNYAYSYSYSDHGDTYAIVRGNSGQLEFSGDVHNDEIKKARSLAHGDFLWFRRGAKSYLVDDPATMAQIEALYKPMEELGRQQETLGRKQEEARVPTPDLSKEMAEINRDMAKLQAKLGKTVSQEDLGELQSKLGDLQGKLGELQGQMGERQGKIGEMQGKLGEEQGKLAEQAERKVRAIIDESLKNGKARPVN